MAKKDLSEETKQLMSLGFSEYEARIYISLLQKSPATAYEISKNTGIARANAYGTCESLIAKSAVQMIEGRPLRFVPVPPDMLFSNIATQTKDLCESVAKGLEDLQPSDEHGFIWSLEGEASVNAKVSEMIRNAKEHIWIKAANDLLETHFDTLNESLSKNPDLKCVIVLFGPDSDRFKFNNNTSVHLHEGTGARLGDADNLFTMTTDHNLALTARMGKDVLAASTSHEPVVTMAETIIRHDVYIAEIFTVFGDEIAAEFGPHLSRLRKQYFSDKQFALFSSKLSSTP